MACTDIAPTCNRRGESYVSLSASSKEHHELLQDHESPIPSVTGRGRVARARAKANNQTSNTTNTQRTQQPQTGNPATLHSPPLKPKRGAVRSSKCESAVATWQACMDRHKERTPPPQRQAAPQPPAQPQSSAQACQPIRYLKTHCWPGKAHSALTVRDEVPLLSDRRSNPQSKLLKSKEDCSHGSANRKLYVQRSADPGEADPA